MNGESFKCDEFDEEKRTAKLYSYALKLWDSTERRITIEKKHDVLGDIIEGISLSDEQ